MRTSLFFIAALFGVGLAACSPAPSGDPVGGVSASAATPADACALFPAAELDTLRVALAAEQPVDIPAMSSPAGQLERTQCVWTGGIAGGNYSISLQATLWRAERGGEAAASFYRQVIGARDGMIEVEPGLFVVDVGHAVEYWIVEGRTMIEVGYMADDAGQHKDALLTMARRIRGSLQ